MALLDIDLYNDFLRGILGVNPTGDPVNDAVYLVLLPMVVLYLFVYSTIHNSRFGGTKTETILMFILAFFIIRGGYYGVFAAFSLPLLIIVVLWNSAGFILGKKKILTGARGDDTSDDGDLLGIKKIRNAVDNVDKLQEHVKREILGDIQEEKGRLTELEGEYKKYCDEWNKVREKTGDRASGDIMHEINVQLDSIVEEARTLIKRINNKDVVKKCAPKLSKKLGIY